MKAIITDKGDPSVGIFPQHWEADVPFEIDEGGVLEAKPNLEFFRERIRKLYTEFAQGRVEVVYDFEQIEMNGL